MSIKSSIGGGSPFPAARTTYTMGSAACSCGSRACGGKCGDDDVAELVASAAKSGTPWYHSYGNGGS